MAYLSKEERDALSKRTEPDGTYCPVCNGEAEVARNGDWRCIASEKKEGWGSFSVLTCGATGVSLGDERVVLSRYRKDEDADQTVSDAD